MSRDRLIAALGVYGALAVLSWGIALAFGRSPWSLGEAYFSSRLISSALSAAVGLAVGIAVVIASQAVSRTTRWGRALERSLRGGLRGLSRRAITPLAFFSSVGEELFFRGALMALLIAPLGAVPALLLSSLLFGLAHVPAERAMIPWTITAGIMGVVLGGMYLLTGELVGSVVAHAVINHANLRYLLRRDESASALSLERSAVLRPR